MWPCERQVKITSSLTGKVEREGLQSGSSWSGVRGADNGVSGKR